MNYDLRSQGMYFSTSVVSMAMKDDFGDWVFEN